MTRPHLLYHFAFRAVLTSLLLVFISIDTTPELQAQVTGATPSPNDSVIVFEPVVPLIGDDAYTVIASQGAGFNVLFSASGWGFGGYYYRDITQTLTIAADAFFTPRRNADEFENAYLGNIPVVVEKVNRVFNVPISLSLRYRLFSESLQESFRPYLTVGVTGTTVLTTPYLRLEQVDEYNSQYRYYEFFESFGKAEARLRGGGFIGFGSNFGSLEKGSTFGLSLRYYVIPYGTPGIESLRDLPMTDFNGLFITLSIGSAW